MKILVLGATGLTGGEVVGQALARGHETTAFVRDASRLDPGGRSPAVVEGDVADYGSVERAVEGQEAVVSALGAPDLKRNPRLTEGIRNVVRAAEGGGVWRLVYESALGAGDSRERVGPLFRYVIGGAILRNALADHEEKERIVMASRLGWTIVRPAGLTRGPRTGVYRTGLNLRDRFPRDRISRADVADFMLDLLTSDEYLRRTPAILY